MRRGAAAGARSLVTVGAGQSNHCRMTAAAGAVLGLEVHLVLSGIAAGTGRRATSCSPSCSAPSCTTSAARRTTGASWRSPASSSPTSSTAPGAAPHSIPIGGSTATGALGYLVGLRRARRAVPGARHAPGGRRPHVVERRHPRRAGRRPGAAAVARRTTTLPDVLAIGVAKGVDAGLPDVRSLAAEALGAARVDADRSATTTSRSTPAGSAPTTACRRRPATRRSAGRPCTAAGCSTAPTPARASPACWATRRPAAGAPAPRSCSSTPAACPPSSPTTARRAEP